MNGPMKTGSVRILAFLAIGATVFFWGLSYISTKSLLMTLTPFQIAASRYTLAVLLMLVFGIGTKQLYPIPFREWPRLFAAAFVGIFVYFIFENSGLKLTTAGMGSLIIATIPVLNIIASVVFLRERIPLIIWAGVILSVIGVFLVIRGGADLSSASFVGNLLVLGAALSWVGYTLLNQPLSHKYDAYSINTYQALFGAVLLILLALGERKPLPGWTVGMIGNLFFLAFCCSILGYIFYTFALRHLGPAVVTTFINLIPVFSVAGGVIILKETLSFVQIIGGLVILLGVTLVSQKERLKLFRVKEKLSYKISMEGINMYHKRPGHGRRA